jgi:hypothetical protein
VVHRDTYDGQAVGDVHAVVPKDRLEGCVALMVAAGDDHGQLARRGDERVLKDGPVQSMPFSRVAAMAGREDVGVFIAEQTMLAACELSPTRPIGSSGLPSAFVNSLMRSITLVVHCTASRTPSPLPCSTDSTRTPGQEHHR